jgi:hypothetical protein
MEISYTQPFFIKIQFVFGFCNHLTVGHCPRFLLTIDCLIGMGRDRDREYCPHPHYLVMGEPTMPQSQYESTERA